MAIYVTHVNDRNGAASCITGCKQWAAQHGIAGEPVCTVFVYCPKDPKSPMTDIKTAPAFPRP
jgi:hypothetical protein